ncbi:MAG: hypothetical protein IPJ85_00685 [Flavobacteriales bacterium]|nr:hypothetical protein [Flavobacteriales bacterium]
MDEEKPSKEDQRYDSYVVGETKKTLVNVLFTNVQSGDGSGFFQVGHDWIGISALIDGEIFATNSHFRGGDPDHVRRQRTHEQDRGRSHAPLG